MGPSDSFPSIENSVTKNKTLCSCSDKVFDGAWASASPPHRVNLALAYTELTEELGRLRALSCKQTEILRKASQEQASPG